MELAHREPENAVDRWGSLDNLLPVSREAFGLKNDVSDEQIKLALLRCEKQGLDPFAGECYLIPYAGKLSVQISIHALLERAMRNPTILRFSDPVLIGKTKDGKVVRVPISYGDSVPVLGAECTAYWKDGSSMVYGMPTGMYAKSRGEPKYNYMLSKAALANACRKACPAETQGLHTQEEMALTVEGGGDAFRYDPSVLHMERIAELSAVGLTVAEANRILGAHTDAAEHRKALDDLIAAREDAQLKEMAASVPASGGKDAGHHTPQSQQQTIDAEVIDLGEPTEEADFTITDDGDDGMSENFPSY